MSFYVGDPGGAYTAAAAGKCCNLNVHLKNYNFSLIKKLFLPLKISKNFDTREIEIFFDKMKILKILTRSRSTRIRVWCVSTAGWATRNLFKNAFEFSGMYINDFEVKWTRIKNVQT